MPFVGLEEHGAMAGDAKPRDIGIEKERASRLREEEGKGDTWASVEGCPEVCVRRSADTPFLPFLFLSLSLSTWLNPSWTEQRGGRYLFRPTEQFFGSTRLVRSFDLTIIPQKAEQLAAHYPPSTTAIQHSTWTIRTGQATRVPV